MYYRLSVICLSVVEKGVYPECVIVCQLSVCLLLKRGFTLNVLSFVSYLCIVEKGVYPEYIIVCQLPICCFKRGFTQNV